jgi:hypothetical protein
MTNEAPAAFRTIFLGFLQEHGIEDPIGYLAEAAHLSRSRIYCYLHDASLGAAPNLIILKFFAYEADQLRRPFELNPVVEYFNLTKEIQHDPESGTGTAGNGNCPGG